VSLASLKIWNTGIYRKKGAGNMTYWDVGDRRCQTLLEDSEHTYIVIGVTKVKSNSEKWINSNKHPKINGWGEVHLTIPDKGEYDGGSDWWKFPHLTMYENYYKSYKDRGSNEQEKKIYYDKNGMIKTKLYNIYWDGYNSNLADVNLGWHCYKGFPVAMTMWVR